MLFTIEDLGFDIDTITSGTGYLNGGGENELLIAAAPNPDTSHRGRNRLEGRDGDDILIGSYGDDIFNPGSGDGYVFAGNGVDRVYIDHTGYTPATGADEVFINFTDTDNKKDFLIFGNDKRQFGTTLGTTFTEVTGWGEEDVLVMRDFGQDINDYYYTVPAGDDLLVYAAHDNNLSVIRIEDVVAQGIDINIIERDTI